MRERTRKIKRIIKQEGPSINEVLDAGIEHGLAALVEELRNPATPLRVKMAIVKTFTYVRKHIVNHEVAAELERQSKAEVDKLTAEFYDDRPRADG